jgi:glycosyl transferase/beta-hydroxylase protein BlmF
MHAGDDIRFTTPGWDTQVRQAFAQSQDKILLVQGDDLSPNREVLATHGFLHRRWVETVGYFLPPLFSCDWNDVWLTEIADALERRVMLPFVTEHQHYSFGKRPADKNASNAAATTTWSAYISAPPKTGGVTPSN